MPITQIPSNFLVTKQPKIFVYNNSTAGTGTYYTALDTTGRGIVTKITLSIGGALNSVLNIRVTIDGVINTFGSPSNNKSIGLSHNSISTNNFGPEYSIDYFCNITYLYSCKIEFMQASGFTDAIHGSIMYSIE